MLKPPLCSSSWVNQTSSDPSLQRYLRSVSINLDGVDAVLGEASRLQEGTVLAQLHALTVEVVSLEQLHPVVLSMLGKDKDMSSH